MQGLRFASSLPVFCRPIVQQVGHFGLRLGRVQVNVTLHSACTKIGTAGKVTLLRSSERNGRFIQGFRPFGSIPACIITSLRDSSFGIFGVCLGGRVAVGG